MRRIVSLITALVLVLGATSLFAVNADWSGYFTAKYRYKVMDYKEADRGNDYNRYAWQKLEIYPTFTLSDNVKIVAGFFNQNYWGTGRLFGIGTEYPIVGDNGSYAGTTQVDPLSQAVDAKGRPQLNTTLGVSAAYADLTFMDQKLNVKIGKLKNVIWGTGAFFGSEFAPYRVSATYKTPMFSGVMIPYFIYELRDTDMINYNAVDASSGQIHMILVGSIYLVPGKTLAAFVWNPVFVGKDYSYVLNGVEYKSGGYATNVKNQSSLYSVVDVYAEHKISLSSLSVKPIIEGVWAYGDLDNGGGITSFYQSAGYWQAQKVKADSLNFLFKVEVNMPKLVTITPEFGWMKTVKDNSDPRIVYINPYGINEFCGGVYSIGKIFNGLRGGADGIIPAGYILPGTSSVQLGDIRTKKPGWWYAKLNVKADLLNEIVSGLNAYAAFIYAGMNSGYQGIGGVNATITYQPFFGVSSSEKSVVMEADLGVSYQIDASTKISADFAIAKWGKANTGVLTNVKAPENGGASQRTDFYYGFDLSVKF